MIRELINFTNNLDEGFKNLGVYPREGLHIMLHYKEENNEISIDTENYEWGIFSKKMDEETALLKKCKFLSQNAWCIDTNKCFDLPTKAIHSCSPFLVAFKREHLEGGEKFKANAEKNKKQIHERFGDYFSKANNLLEDSELEKNKVFEYFFSRGEFLKILNKIDELCSLERSIITKNIEELSAKIKETNDKDEKEKLKEKSQKAIKQLLAYKPLDESNYILFYLDKSLDQYIVAHQRYLADKLFNTEKYNTKPNEEGRIFGTSNFKNGFNSNMPFLTHQTASFEITGRISDLDAKLLYEFEQILPRKILPNPLPIFVYDDEMQDSAISLFKDSEFKLSYKDIIEQLNETYKRDINNYYLLYWQNSKDGPIFQDFDFVSKFEYEFDAQIDNLFEIHEKGKGLVHYPKISNIFQLEQMVFKPLIQSKYLRVDYFGDLKGEDYEGLNSTFQSFSKYRKGIYDYVYKSKRKGITEHIFFDMVFSRIKDDLKNNNGYSIKDKLNIWFSLYEKFTNKTTDISMASKLKHYHDFVAQLSMGNIEPSSATDAEFAFAAGQVIDYLISKSQAQDKSYLLLEPYLQQAKCQEFKKAIANDIARYKHAIKDNETRFKSVCDFVLTYETNANIKELMPEILAGTFSKCQFFHKSTDSISTNSNQN